MKKLVAVALIAGVAMLAGCSSSGSMWGGSGSTTGGMSPTGALPISN